LGAGDGKNYTQFELEKNKFRHSVIANGKPNKGSPVDAAGTDVFDVQIDVTTNKISTRIGGVLIDQVLDAPNLQAGKFMFLLEGKDEIAVSSFSFAPAR